MKPLKRKQDKVQVVTAAVAVGSMYPPELKPTAWKDVVEEGPVRVVLYAEERPFGNVYRFLLANRFYKHSEQQWLDAINIPKAIKALQEANKKSNRAKQKLEGGLLRRLFRAVF